tara:strand:- start:47894 stop:48373 length:480 start_codon:yes stop_codon:yes gene_type:complete
MKNFLIMSVFFVAGLAQADVEFNKAACLKVMPAAYTALCGLHEDQFKQLSFRKDVVYGYSYTSCDRFTGQVSAPTTRTVPCLVYFAENESKKEIAIQSIFGNTPRYPLSYKGLFVGVIVRARQVQMGHNSGIPQRQYGESQTVRQYGDSQNGLAQQQMQ